MSQYLSTAGQPQAEITAAGRRWNWEKIFPIVAILPALLVIALFTIYPVGYAVSISFYKNLLTRPNDHPFVGLGNFTDVITSYYFQQSIITTVTYTITVLVVVMVIGFAIALLLNTKVRTAGLLKIVILLPWAVPAVVSGLLWKWILNADFGALNGALYSLGLISSYIPFLADPRLAQISLVVAHVWREAPLVAIFFLAGLQLIPSELYEAAKIDGGSFWSTLRFVTLPILRPTILVILVYETMMAILTFDVIYVLTGGGPANATSLLSWFAYAEIYRNLNLGHGVALAIIIALITLVLVFIYLRVLHPEEEAYA